MEKKFPPVLDQHYRREYRDTRVYFGCRRRYTITYAIMCAVGYFIGLGDRHPFNILLDNNCDTVHVDINYIFDKARSLSIPEKVPFRLTQNVVDGFGLCGTNGLFQATLTETLALIKHNKSIIMSNLLSFIYDPLYENINFSLDRNENGERLVREATDADVLREMYIGWRAFV
ncbi:putative serine/threonine-protein kinase MEC1 like protein [Dictyocoela roeselum]|nr:putative serine/threonine-protein kinase MEC1 like protein [Dictyocoela roeselum]